MEKLEVEREALGSGVFDVLGRVFEGTELRKLLIAAIRYGDQPDARARLTEVVDKAMDREHLRELLEERALAHDSMDAGKVRKVREVMERPEARRLQPHFIRAFFLEAFRLLGGSVREREPKRFEVTHVPAAIRSRDRQIGIGEPMLSRYERTLGPALDFDEEQPPIARSGGFNVVTTFVLRHIAWAAAGTVTITKNEILTGLNKPDEFILAIVLLDGDHVHEPVYIRRPITHDSDFGVTSVNYDLAELVARGARPA